jgi:hypothetical protein
LERTFWRRKWWLTTDSWRCRCVYGTLLRNRFLCLSFRLRRLAVTLDEWKNFIHDNCYSWPLFHNSFHSWQSFQFLFLYGQFCSWNVKFLL